MLFEHEEKYIKTISPDKVVNIRPLDLKATKLAEEIIQRINKVCPDLKVLHIGASGLGISGQGDLDIYALAAPNTFSEYLPQLIKLFGPPKSQKEDSIAWEFKRNVYEVEFYLTNPESPTMKRQLAVFNILKDNKDLLKEYEKLKEDMDGQSFREYQRKKYEFYHKVLGLNQTYSH